jgi:hypothetical protein
MRTLEEQLADFLSGYPQFKLAILFGSQATGGATGGLNRLVQNLGAPQISSICFLRLSLYLDRFSKVSASMVTTPHMPAC